jgi:dienelactone hydrolase
LTYQWFVYPEAGTYRGHVTIEGTNAAIATVRIPGDASGQSIHVIVAVTDTGQPPLTRYRRAVLAANTTNSWPLLAPFSQPPPDLAGQFGPYGSPLKFEDGKLVETAADWARRRQEILRQWHELMGPWPPILQGPRVEFLSQSRRQDFTQHRVRLEIAPGQNQEGWLLAPEGQGPFPAVLVLYYEPETSIGLGKEPRRDFGLQLAQRGFVTLSIGTPGGNAWKPELGSAQCQPLSFHAYVAANCWRALANLPQVDPARIGVVGHSYGGKWALFAGALWEKFAAVAVSDPGIVFDETRPNVNYWEPWYLGRDAKQPRPEAGLPSALNPRTGAYKRMVETGRDLPELHALIAPRPFLVSGGSEDPPTRWLALNHLLALNKMLGYTNRVALTSRPSHTPTEESNRQLYAFFEHFLKNGPANP